MKNVLFLFYKSTDINMYLFDLCIYYQKNNLKMYDYSQRLNIAILKSQVNELHRSVN